MIYVCCFCLYETRTVKYIVSAILVSESLVSVCNTEYTNSLA